MKRITLFCIIICSCLTMYSQATDIVVDCQNPGWLSSMISYGDQQSVRNLKVTGYVNATDLKFIGTLISTRSLDGRLDLSECNIVKDVSEGEDDFLGSYLATSNNESLRTLIIPKSVSKVIGCIGSLFVDSLIFDCQMKYIDSDCLGGTNTNVNNLILGENIDSIPGQSLINNRDGVGFCRVKNLKRIHMSNSMRYIGDCAFMSANVEYVNLQKLTKLDYLGSFAFVNYSSLWGLSGYQPDTLYINSKSFNSSAFSYKEGQHIYIGKDVETIGYGADLKKTYSFGNNLIFHMKSSVPPSGTLPNNTCIVYVPKGTKEAYEKTGWPNVVEVNLMYSLIISSSGNGYVSFNTSTIKNQTKSFTIEEGTSATITFTPDNGYRIKSVKVSDVDVTSDVSNSSYTISSINSDMSVEVEFEAIPPTTYTLSITTSGNGSAIYSNITVKNKTQEFTVTEGTSVTITFTPDNGYRIKSVKVNDTDVTASVTNNQYTISNISANTTLTVEFEAIPPTTYTLSITASGNGSATYNNTAIKNKTQEFTVTEGASATITFTPDNGYRIKSVKVNDTDVTSKVADSKYTISSISANTTLAVTFEEIPPTTYTLSITASGNGSATYNNTAIKNKTQEFTVTEGTSATITFSPDNGYRIKSVKVNDADVTSKVADSKYTISSISANTTIAVTFEEIPPTTYTLSITASGNGSATYNNTAIKNKTQEFTVTEGASATITFTPDNGYRIKSVKVNDSDVTSKVADSKYTISSISANTTLAVTFEEIPPTTYTLSITVSGNGSATYNNTAIKNKTQEFTVTEGTSATITFTPDNGYRIKNVKVNNTDVTSKVVDNKYTISSISTNTTLAVAFEAIPVTTYSLNITVIGNGSTIYNSTVIKNQIQSFIVEEGASATILFYPDNGYRIKSVELDDTDVTSKVADNQYTIISITANTTLKVEFEAIPTTTYSLSIKATGNGSVNYDRKAIKNQNQSFVVSKGTYVYLSFSPDNGFRVSSLTVNGEDLVSLIVNNTLVFNIMDDTNVDVVFDEIPQTTHTLTISSTGSGEVTCQDITVRGESKSLSIVEGDNALITVLPDAGNRIKSVKVDGTDVSASLVNNQYTIAKIEKDMKLEVAFEAITNLSVDGVNYTVVSYENQTVNVIEGDYGLVLDIPSSITANDNTWKVIGVERGALNNNIDLAAIIWNPETKFDGNVSNPNLLLYVKDKSYAPAEIKNVIVNGVAEAITLTDAESGNNFYCPQAFTAKSITYEHNYSMKSGYNVCQGWETIVLPFDVGTISRESGEVLVPYASWSIGSSQRPFWLYSLASDGWKAETAIKANTPYIICMPNNEYYDAAYNIKGNVMFAVSNVEIKASDNLPNSKSGDRTFVPNYQNQEAAQNIYALNVNNLWSKNTDSSLAEGSAFISDSRPVRPFEAYMTTESGSASRCIYIFGDDETTGMLKLPPLNTNLDGEVRVYSLSGTFIKQGNDEKVLKDLSKGVYIIKGRKVLVK